MRLNVNRLLWVIYLALLGVLLPHTAWTFGRFEPVASGWLGIPWGQVTAWAAAFALEAAVAVFTHKLSGHNERVPRYTAGWVQGRTFAYKYLNPYGVALILALGYSALANFTHAEEFGQTLAVFARYDVHPLIYSVAFGGILPAVSLVFAIVLSETADTERERDEALEAAKKTEMEAKRELAEVRKQLGEAETRFAAAGDLFARLFAQEKRERILATYERWPALPPSAIAVITESSPSYVSEVLNNQEQSE